MFGKSSGEWTSRQQKDKTERVTGLGTRTREEGTVKWNQMTVLGLQSGGRHQTSLASLQGESHKQGRIKEGGFDRLALGGYPTLKYGL